MFLKIVSLICVVAIVIRNSSAEDDHAKITEFLKKFANLNVEEILSNDRLFQSYHKCFMEVGPCTAEARDMRGK